MRYSSEDPEIPIKVNCKGLGMFPYRGPETLLTNEMKMPANVVWTEMDSDSNGFRAVECVVNMLVSKLAESRIVKEYQSDA